MKKDEETTRLLKTLFSYKYTFVFLSLVAVLIFLYYLLSRDAPQKPSINEIGGAVILSLIGAIAVSIVFDVFIRHDFVNVVARSARLAVEEVIDGFSSTYSAGILNVHASLNDEILQRAAEDSSSIKILQTFIPDGPHATRLLRAVGEKRDSDVKIILFDPNSAFAEFRARELGSDVGTVVSDFRKFVRELAKLDFDVELYIYDGMPACSIYGFDHRIFVGRFLIGRDAIDGTQIECRNPSTFANDTLHYFEDVRRKSKRYDYRGSPG